MLYRATEGRLALADTSMDYVAFGRGERPMLLIPGLNLRGVKGSALPLAWMYRMFARDWRVYVFDRRADVPEDCSILTLADDIDAAMAQLGLREADVLGVSQGGMIAQALAIRHPERVRRLALGVTAGRCNDTIRRVVGGWIDAAQRGDWRSVNRESVTLAYSRAYLRRMGFALPLLERLVKPADGPRFIRLARTTLSFDLLDRLGEIRCPALVLGGREDMIVTGEASLELAERLRCPVHLYDGLGHAAYDEAPDFNRRVLSFFRQE